MSGAFAILTTPFGLRPAPGFFPPPPLPRPIPVDFVKGYAVQTDSDVIAEVIPLPKRLEKMRA